MALSAAGCGYRPAMFADRPAVTRVHDDRPIERPRRQQLIDELYQADAYVRRELVGGLDPRRSPLAVDVSSEDEVPASSWFSPPANVHEPLRDYHRDGPPVPPLTPDERPSQSDILDAVVVTDARGLAYELQPDTPGRPGMRTAAAAIASRLVFALGYRTPPVWITKDAKGRRVSATRWPPGRDLGPTPISSTRPDDPNDRLPHADRRTLRALGLVAAWLDIRRLRPQMLRDAYRGEPGAGHVRHYLVGLDGALGVDRYFEALEFARDPDRGSANLFLKLFSLGLSPKPPSIEPQTPWPSVGLLSASVLPDEHSVSPPFEPMDRLTSPDAYWLAKRLAALPRATIRSALLAGELPPAPTAWYFARLIERRATIIAWAFGLTTPCEVVALEPSAAGGRRLVLADLAVVAGLAPGRGSYRLSYFDAEGRSLEGPAAVFGDGPIVKIELSAALLEQAYVVVRVLAQRAGRDLPRHFEAHLRASGGDPHLVGVRH